MEDACVKVEVKCPRCEHSLMNPRLEIDGLPAIDLEAKVRDRLGHIYLSQVYGSYARQFGGVDDLTGSITAFSCPHCHDPLPVAAACDCGAPMLVVGLAIGGRVKFCSRNGCRKHSIEFENVEDMFELFESQSSVG